MSFQQGLSGLNAASQSLDAIGNNVANADTVGYKESDVQFADVYANTLAGSASQNVGIGVQVAAVAQTFSQGDISSSSNPLDMAISGDGFFRMSNNGAITYTRNGQFQLNNQGYIVNSSGEELTGYPASAAGVLATGSPVPLQINSSNSLPQATSEYNVSLTLDSRDATLSAASFNPDDATTYSSSTSVPVYDSLGNTHTLQTYYVNTGGGQWSVFATNDGVPVGYTPPATPVPIGTMTFSSDGVLTSTTPSPMTAALDVTTGATTPLNISINYAGTQQDASDFGVNQQSQDGFAPGSLSSFSVSSDGTIVGSYTNGRSSVLGQVVLTNFANPNGLQNLGDNQWAETADSGVPLTSTPGTSGLGSVQSSSIESSNVDLTTELVNLITAQRFYQANAQSIKTQDDVLQTLVSLQ